MRNLIAPVLVGVFVLIMGLGGAVVSRTYRTGQTPWALYIGAFIAVLGILLLAGFVARAR